MGKNEITRILVVLNCSLHYDQSGTPKCDEKADQHSNVRPIVRGEVWETHEIKPARILGSCVLIDGCRSVRVRVRADPVEPLVVSRELGVGNERSAKESSHGSV